MKKDYDATWGDLCLVKIRIEEGRKHQIRVHVSEVLQTPLLGDIRYFNKNPLEKLFKYNKESAIFLHSLSTSIHNTHLCNLISKYQSSNFTHNDKGSIHTSNNILTITAEFPPHFHTLFSQAFNNQSDLQVLLNMIQQTTL